MSLVATGGLPLTLIGAANREGVPSLAAFNSSLLDAANEACILIGQLSWADGGSHTVDTTGSSSIQVRTAAVTFANAGTTVVAGIAAVDTGNGPTGRAVNVANVITFDVACSMTGGGGGVTANAWQTYVPTTGTKTIAHMAFVAIAVQMTARAGADVVNISNAGGLGSENSGYVTNYLGGSYSNAFRLPNVVVVASDGTLGFIAGGYVATTSGSSYTWDSSSGTKEYGNFLQFPYPVTVYGMAAGLAVASNFDLVLYGDPLGTPSALATLSIDANTVATNASSTPIRRMLGTPVDLAANTPYAVAVKPGASSVTMDYITMDAASHQGAWDLGTNAYAVSRAAAAFSAINSSKDRFAIGVLAGKFDAGGAAGAFGHGNMTGGLQ